MVDTKEAVLMTEIARSEHRQWTRATVTRDGRIFVSYPRWSDNVFVSVGELLPSGEVRSYPDEDWNKWHRRLGGEQVHLRAERLCRPRQGLIPVGKQPAVV